MNKKDIKILLVDDEPDILEFMSYNLSNEGYKVYTEMLQVNWLEQDKIEWSQLVHKL